MGLLSAVLMFALRVQVKRVENLLKMIKSRDETIALLSTTLDLSTNASRMFTDLILDQMPEMKEHVEREMEAWKKSNLN